MARRAVSEIKRQIAALDRAARDLHDLPDRTLDTMSEAQDLAMSHGRMSGRASRAASERLRVALFGKHGWHPALPEQPSPATALRRQAAELRDLAARGMKPRAYAKRAAELDVEAERLDATASNVDASSGLHDPRTERVPAPRPSTRHRLNPKHDAAEPHRIERGGYSLCGARAKQRMDRVGSWRPNWTKNDEEVTCRECRRRVDAGYDDRQFSYAANNPYARATHASAKS